MDKYYLLEDFIYVVDTIKATHPLGINRIAYEFTSFINKSLLKIKNKSDLLLSLCKLTAILKDSNTNIEVKYSAKDSCINLPCTWLKNGLFVTKSFNEILSADKIIGIGNLTINEIIEKLENIISSENKYLIKIGSISYSIKNYHLFSNFVLKALGVLEGNMVKITVNRYNKYLVFNTILEEYNEFLDIKANNDSIKY